jgi:hypothetical protein
MNVFFSSNRTYKLQFGRRKQLVGEIPKKFASELKRFYDKAYRHRDQGTRQEDLLHLTFHSGFRQFS